MTSYDILPSFSWSTSQTPLFESPAFDFTPAPAQTSDALDPNVPMRGSPVSTPPSRSRFGVAVGSAGSVAPDGGQFGDAQSQVGGLQVVGLQEGVGEEDMDNQRGRIV